MPTPSESSTVGGLRPDVSVVVIAYNDAARLPEAVASVLDQTLRALEVIVVDDASTDGTWDVAQALAEAHPDRVRAIRLPENSGGCSRPRNTGIDAAQGDYVMFLDSDDSLERHAAKNLLLTAERTGADLVSGLCVRVNVTNENKRTRWYARLYAEHATYDSIRDAPELLFDTLSTNKLYRREFLDRNGIRFPDGLHYEDLLFSTEAYCTAQPIAILPVEVYRWHVVEDAATASISNRRNNIANFRDRLQIHQRIDAYLVARGFDDLRPIKDRKFILQDLKLYLTDLARRDATYQEAWLNMAADYLETVSDEAVVSAGPLAAATAYLVRRRDLDETLHAAELWIHGRLSGGLCLDSGRAYLTGRYLEDDLGRELLDVTALHLHDAPFSRRNMRNRLVSIAGDRTAELRGEINDPLRAIDADDELSATLELRTADGRHRVDIARPQVELTAQGTLTWRASLAARRRPPRMPPNVKSWGLWMTLHHGDSVNVSQVISTTDVTAGRRLPWKRSPWTGQSLLWVERGPGDGVWLRVERASKAWRLADRVWSRVRRSGVYGDLRRLFLSARSRGLKSLVYRSVLVRLPVRRGTAVFESQLGRVYADNPKYVYRALRSAGDNRRVVWSYTESTSGWPQDAVLVKRASWRYFYELARAELWVDNQGFPPGAPKRRGTKYLQTWHGSPYKAMGFDQPQLQFGPADKRAEFAAGVGRWTHFCVQSPFADDTFRRAFRHSAKSLPSGYPRNDPLLRYDAAAVKDLRAQLELPDDRQIVLYAPTFRDSDRVTRTRSGLRLNLARLSELVGDRCYLLVRAHYLDRGSVPTRYSSFARDVSDYPDTTELLLLADGLITDYSSVMFDYALLRRPMLFYAYDLELYNQTRGSYFDLETEAPGPVVKTEDGVAEWLSDFRTPHLAYAERLERFVDKFCTYETGHASEDVVREFFGVGT
ncbi:MAG TPA: bifunctional glycosyltransferase family 2 protein/CDP-glycerol:glycerophosphate glycerophosphotransferase [Mycobacteriales bacterium]|nr:bifunctional glycosyltransferase family 2 protein/CDP-glycerol:glycerophosphate glycerophosphotransferase [Mycobacteriales bacterium]